MILSFKQLIITKIKTMLGVDVQICRQKKTTADSYCCCLQFYMTLSSTDSQIALLMFVDPLAATEACLLLSTFACSSFFFFSLNCGSVDCQLPQVK